MRDFLVAEDTSRGTLGRVSNLGLRECGPLRIRVEGHDFAIVNQTAPFFQLSVRLGARLENRHTEPQPCRVAEDKNSVLQMLQVASSLVPPVVVHRYPDRTQSGYRITIKDGSQPL